MLLLGYLFFFSIFLLFFFLNKTWLLEIKKKVSRPCRESIVNYSQSIQIVGIPIYTYTSYIGVVYKYFLASLSIFHYFHLFHIFTTLYFYATFLSLPLFQSVSLLFIIILHYTYNTYYLFLFNIRNEWMQQIFILFLLVSFFILFFFVKDTFIMAIIQGRSQFPFKTIYKNTIKKKEYCTSRKWKRIELSMP